MSLVDTVALREVAVTEYADIVVGVLLSGPNETRIFLKAGICPKSPDCFG
jgi:hypothetical protein